MSDGYCSTCGAADQCGECNHTPPEYGARIRASGWAPSAVIDDNITVPPGTAGTVGHCKLNGGVLEQIWVTWDNGENLNLCVGGPTPDRWEYA